MGFSEKQREILRFPYRDYYINSLPDWRFE